MDDEIRQEDTWDVIRKYFDENGLVQQQRASYEEFIIQNIQEVIDDYKGQIEVVATNQYLPGMQNKGRMKLQIEFGKIKISRPKIQEVDGKKERLLPYMARLRKTTYACTILVQITKRRFMVTDEGTRFLDEDDDPRVPLGKIPVMLRASEVCWLHDKDNREIIDLKECPQDKGGYFIINGSEKVLLAQERRANNLVFCFKKTIGKFAYMAEVGSQMEKGNKPPSTLYMKLWNRENNAKFGQSVVVTLPYVRKEIPIVILFRALGIESDREVLEHIVYNLEDMQMMEALRPSLDEAAQGKELNTREAALDYIGRRAVNQATSKENRIRHAQDILIRELLPHIGITEEALTKKQFFLGYTCHRLLACSLGRRPPDDRDHYANKRVDMAGPLMLGLFKGNFKRLIKEFKKTVQDCVDRGKEPNISSALKQDYITKGIKYSMATGNWGVGKSAVAGQATRTGVSQVLSRLTFAAALSHLRRSNTPIGKEGKVAQPRQLHNSHWGVVCPAETPEGQACGLVKNLSLMTYVSVGGASGMIKEILENEGMESLEELASPAVCADNKFSKVFLNGVWVGMTDRPEQLTQILREQRRENQVGGSIHEIGVARDISERELFVSTDCGRLMRPLLLVGPDGLINLKRRDLVEHEQTRWSEMLGKNFFEYIDVMEEETCYIAMLVKDVGSNDLYRYTHCEIHPAMILGVCASIIPFPDHNQSPRNCYQSAMGKQAMGIYATNFQWRIDTLAHVLFYPQKPLCKTNSMDFLKFRELPAGQNLIVAIAVYSGYNQEDSLIMNQSSIDRGLFRSMFFRSYVDEAKEERGICLETFERPAREELGTGVRVNYDKLDVDGLTWPAQDVGDRDIIIGKTTLVKNQDESDKAPQATKRDASTRLRHNETGVVDQVLLTTNHESGQRFVQIKVRAVRVPQIGDKFASRHGQKGTVGITYRMDDMPFSCEGISPDLIVNPHAIPSRMTIGHLIETLLGKIGSIRGYEGDATPFNNANVKDLSDELNSHGYQRHGNERLYNGHTGRPMSSLIFFGPTYYQRLKHMVDDKIHSRARGPTQMLNRQPMEGRARDGGLRFGEMERDCMISHGAANVLREKLFLQSDGYMCHVCEDCGLIAIANLDNNSFLCPNYVTCKNSSIARIEIPYAAKLLFQELMAMMIAPRLMTTQPGNWRLYDS
mmetsp:Transcript_70577/g.188361  ORF Transcript_70577/g.188361 Transcript_70577/m.188361 type:complete len:1176 (-) Transcript_70577:60-3587(-)|eukprot:CAMPEP_0113678576 /NCGR_PEP_ID=MMETSP0038_2-20120614/10045_1 /TAXON_ID=2898 /ORGANISM="Cryptomonas paramecium" /LENGTH=1175 /DNA_ID=CAMNT_0000596271 /DNA_START=112 /DNA_END=3639 /DNA_ORIENTATION=+ /assembly_acc=CAM_ASM_000170